VVDQRDPEQTTGCEGIARRPDVVAGRLGVARRVIVRKEDTRGVAADGLGEELGDPDRRAGDVPLVSGVDAHEPLLAVQQRDEHDLSVEVRKAWDDHARGARRGVDGLAGLCGDSCAPTELARGEDPRRRGGPKAQAGCVGTGEGTYVLELGDERDGHRERIAPGTAGPDEDGEQLGVGQRCGAPVEQSLAGARAHGPFTDDRYDPVIGMDLLGRVAGRVQSGSQIVAAEAVRSAVIARWLVLALDGIVHEGPG
jgi:hypothetical protein